MAITLIGAKPILSAALIAGLDAAYLSQFIPSSPKPVSIRRNISSKMTDTTDAVNMNVEAKEILLESYSRIDDNTVEEPYSGSVEDAKAYARLNNGNSTFGSADVFEGVENDFDNISEWGDIDFNAPISTDIEDYGSDFGSDFGSDLDVNLDLDLDLYSFQSSFEDGFGDAFDDAFNDAFGESETTSNNQSNSFENNSTTSDSSTTTSKQTQATNNSSSNNYSYSGNTTSSYSSQSNQNDSLTTISTSSESNSSYGPPKSPSSSYGSPGESTSSYSAPKSSSTGSAPAPDYKFNKEEYDAANAYADENAGTADEMEGRAREQMGGIIQNNAFASNEIGDGKEPVTQFDFGWIVPAAQAIIAINGTRLAMKYGPKFADDIYDFVKSISITIPTTDLKAAGQPLLGTIPSVSVLVV